MLPLAVLVRHGNFMQVLGRKMNEIVGEKMTN